MARVSKFVAEARWYVPSIESNRDDPDPFRVLIEPMTAREFSAVQREAFGGALTKDGDVLSKAESIRDSIIKARVSNVQGYSVHTPRGVLTPRNGAELVDTVWQASPEELAILDDIFGAIQKASQLEAGLVGKLSAPSDSFTAATSPSGVGDAASAIAQTNQTASNRKSSDDALEIVTPSQTKAPGTSGSQITSTPCVSGQS